MVRGGVSIVTSMDIASKVSANKVLERSLDTAKEKIIDGSDIASSLENDRNFPLLMVRMVGIGESSGRLHMMLDNVSDMYEDEVEGSIAIATSIFEPIIIVLFGGVILVLVLAIYVPIFTITMSMRGGV